MMTSFYRVVAGGAVREEVDVATVDEGLADIEISKEV